MNLRHRILILPFLLSGPVLFAQNPDVLLGAPYDTAISPNGIYAATSTRAGEVILFDTIGPTEPPDPVQLFNGPAYSGVAGTLIPADNLVVTDLYTVVVGDGGAAGVPDIVVISNTSASIVSTGVLDSPPTDITVSPNGNYVIVTTTGVPPGLGMPGSLNVYDLTLPLPAVGLAPRVTAPFFFPWAPGNPPGLLPTAGDWVEATDNYAIGITHWFNNTGVVIVPLTPGGVGFRQFYPEQPYDLAISPDGSRAVINLDASTLIFDLTANPITSTRGVEFNGRPLTAVDSAVMSNDHAVILDLGRAYVYDLATFQQTATINLMGDVLDLDIAPDGSYAAVRTTEEFVVFDPGAPSPVLAQCSSATTAPAAMSDIVAIDNGAAVSYRNAFNPAVGFVQLVEILIVQYANGTCQAVANMGAGGGNPGIEAVDVSVGQGGSKVMVVDQGGDFWVMDHLASPPAFANQGNPLSVTGFTSVIPAAPPVDWAEVQLDRMISLVEVATAMTVVYAQSF